MEERGAQARKGAWKCQLILSCGDGATTQNPPQVSVQGVAPCSNRLVPVCPLSRQPLWIWGNLALPPPIHPSCLLLAWICDHDFPGRAGVLGLPRCSLTREKLTLDPAHSDSSLLSSGEEGSWILRTKLHPFLGEGHFYLCVFNFCFVMN